MNASTFNYSIDTVNDFLKDDHKCYVFIYNIKAVFIPPLHHRPDSIYSMHWLAGSTTCPWPVHLVACCCQGAPVHFLTNRLLLYNCICIYEFIAFGCEYQIGLRPSLVSTCLLPSLYFPLSPLNGGNIWKSIISGVTF